MASLHTINRSQLLQLYHVKCKGSSLQSLLNIYVGGKEISTANWKYAHLDHYETSFIVVKYIQNAVGSISGLILVQPGIENGTLKPVGTSA